jgi:hypothetical protein
MNEKYHEMILEKTHIAGVEEWYCPTCGRRFLMQWPPAHRMIILEAGDKDTRHNVSKADSGIGPRQTTQLESTDLIDEFRLIPWLKWMEKVDFDSMWSKNI